MKILRQVTLDRAARRKDKSVSLTFITSLEQSSSDFMEIDKLLNDTGVLYFKSNGNLNQQEIKELDSVNIEVEGKTKSERLRNVLYVLHKETNQLDSFNEFYTTHMEKLIQHYKDKIPQD
jgi:hypothetical protein